MPINPKEIPFIRFIIPFIAGIILGYYYQLPEGWSWLLIGLLIILLGTFAYFSFSLKFRSSYFILPTLFFFALGITFVSSELREKQVSIPENGNAGHYVVKIKSPIKKGKYYQTNGQLLYALDEQVQAIPASGEIHLTLDFEKEETIKPGNTIAFKGDIKPIEKPKNPNAFDFKKFKANEGITHSAFLKSGSWQAIGSAATYNLSTIAKQIQTELSQVLSNYIKGPNEIAVANSLILGNRSQLDKTLQKAYSTTGALHVLAVSGLHVGIIYLLILFFLKKLNAKKYKWIRLAIVLFSIWSFVLITGAAPSVIRAATMFSLMGIGNALQRYPNIYNILAQAAFLMLLYDPLLIFNISFQLSFAAVCSIVFFQPKIYKYWIIDNWLGDYIWKLISLGIAAQIGTLPIALYYFHQFPIFFWASGIIVVPAASVILLAGLCLLIFHFIFSPIAIIIGKFLSGFIWLMNACIFTLEKLPGSAISGIYISPMISFILYAGLFLIIFSNLYKKRKGIYLGFALIALTFIPGWINAYQSKDQNKLVIYHQSYSTLIDHWHANEAKYFIEGNISEKNNIQTSSGARAANYIQQSTQWPQNEIHENDNFSVLELNGEHIILLKEFPKAILQKPIRARGIIIQNTPFMNWEKFDDYFKVDFVVADGSNKPWVTSKWADELSSTNKNFEFWDTSKQGAFLMDL